MFQELYTELFPTPFSLLTIIIIGISDETALHLIEDNGTKFFVEIEVLNNIISFLLFQRF